MPSKITKAVFTTLSCAITTTRAAQDTLSLIFHKWNAPTDGFIFDDQTEPYQQIKIRPMLQKKRVQGHSIRNKEIWGNRNSDAGDELIIRLDGNVHFNIYNGDTNKLEKWRLNYGKNYVGKQKIDNIETLKQLLEDQRTLANKTIMWSPCIGNSWGCDTYCWMEFYTKTMEDKVEHNISSDSETRKGRESKAMRRVRQDSKAVDDEQFYNTLFEEVLALNDDDLATPRSDEEPSESNGLPESRSHTNDNEADVEHNEVNSRQDERRRRLTTLERLCRETRRAGMR